MGKHHNVDNMCGSSVMMSCVQREENIKGKCVKVGDSGWSGHSKKGRLYRSRV